MIVTIQIDTETRDIVLDDYLAEAAAELCAREGIGLGDLCRQVLVAALYERVAAYNREAVEASPPRGMAEAAQSALEEALLAVEMPATLRRKLH